MFEAANKLPTIANTAHRQAFLTTLTPNSHVNGGTSQTHANVYKQRSFPPKIADLKHGPVFRNAALQFAEFDKAESLEGVIFLDCTFPPGTDEEKVAFERSIIAKGAIVIKSNKSGTVPLNVARTKMYDLDELRVKDTEIYKWVTCRKIDQNKPAADRVMTRFDEVMIALHDGVILDLYEQFVAERHVVGVMGGHAMLRSDKNYANIARLCWRLAKQGFVISTGGGPGAMEAANLGAYFVRRTETELEDAIRTMAESKKPEDIKDEFDFIQPAENIRKKYPVSAEEYDREKCFSVGVPTWWYGHEPPNQFALWQAKFVSNAIREDILVNRCNAGMIFAPGAAGTRTEVFQYAVPQAYSKETATDYSKPMIFYSNFWIENTIYTTTLNVAQREDQTANRMDGYSNRIYCLDDNEKVIRVLDDFRKKHAKPVSDHSTANGDSATKPSEDKNVRGKRAAGREAANRWIVKDNITVGVGSGTTVQYFVEALADVMAERQFQNIVCVPTSAQSRSLLQKQQAKQRLEGKPSVVISDLLVTTEVHVCVDGADEVDAQMQLIKGGGGALLQERVLGARAGNYVVIADSRKDTGRLGNHFKQVPIEVLPLAHKRVIEEMSKRFPGVEAALSLTGNTKTTPSVTDNGNFLLEANFSSPNIRPLLDDPRQLAIDVRAIAGVIDVGLFTDMVTESIFGEDDGTVYTRTRVDSRDRAEERKEQRKVLLEVLDRVKKAPKTSGKRPVVEIDLDLTAALPYARTIAALQETGRLNGIAEFATNPQQYVHRLPGYTADAWNVFIEQDAVKQIRAKYPQLPWVASLDSKSKDIPYGQPGATLHSVFHVRFWGRPDELEFDMLCPGLQNFAKEVQRVGGIVVFLSGRWTEPQKEATARFGAKYFEKFDIVIGNPTHDDAKGKSDGEIKRDHQKTIRDTYGEPVAFFDDRAGNLEAVKSVAENALFVLMQIPGFSAAQKTGEFPISSTFELDYDAAGETERSADANKAVPTPVYEPERRSAHSSSASTQRLLSIAMPAATVRALTANVATQRLVSDDGAEGPTAAAEGTNGVRVRVGSFNCENLFFRIDFQHWAELRHQAEEDGDNQGDQGDGGDLPSDESAAGGDAVSPSGHERRNRRGNGNNSGGRSNKPYKEQPGDFWKYTKRTMWDEQSKVLTADAIMATDADILAVEEVESLEVLDQFVKTYVNKYVPNDKQYGHRMLIVGNDQRHINVGLISRFPIVHLRSYRDDVDQNGNSIFSRDCLEARVQVAPKTYLTLFINHFKSMMGSREKTRAKRVKQADRVLEILKDQPSLDNTIVLGDFNDYTDGEQDQESAINGLVYDSNFVNVLDRLEPNDRWTHYYNSSKEPEDKRYKQLDFVLVSKNLADSADNKSTLPIVVRKGQPTRASRVSQHFEGVGLDHPKASDHCPLAIDLIVPVDV